MDGLSRALGVGTTITLCGETFVVEGKCLRYYGMMEAEVLKLRPEPTKIMREALDVLRGDKEALRAVISQCYEENRSYAIVTGEELRSWLNTVSGKCFLVWLMIRENDRQRLTLEKVTELYMDDMEEISRAAVQAALEAGKTKAEADQAGHEARTKRENEVDRVIDHASGEDQLGNSTGRFSKVEEAAHA